MSEDKKSEANDKDMELEILELEDFDEDDDFLSEDDDGSDLDIATLEEEDFNESDEEALDKEALEEEYDSVFLEEDDDGAVPLTAAKSSNETEDDASFESFVDPVEKTKSRGGFGGFAISLLLLAGVGAGGYYAYNLPQVKEKINIDALIEMASGKSSAPTPQPLPMPEVKIAQTSPAQPEMTQSDIEDSLPMPEVHNNDNVEDELAVVTKSENELPLPVVEKGNVTDVSNDQENVGTMFTPKVDVYSEVPEIPGDENLVTVTEKAPAIEEPETVSVAETRLPVEDLVVSQASPISPPVEGTRFVPDIQEEIVFDPETGQEQFSVVQDAGNQVNASSSTPLPKPAQVASQATERQTSVAKEYFEHKPSVSPSDNVQGGLRRVSPSKEPAQKFVVVKKSSEAQSTESVLLAAKRAMKLQRYDAAVEFYNDLYAKNKRDLRILVGRAVALQKSGRIDAAAKAYEEVLALDPKNTEVIVNMLGLIRSNNPSTALQRLLKLKQDHPTNPDLLAQIGVTHADLGNFKEAVQALSMASTLDPRNARHLYNMAVVAERMKDTNSAIRYYEKALEVDAVYAGGSISRDVIYKRLQKLRRM